MTATVARAGNPAHSNRTCLTAASEPRELAIRCGVRHPHTVEPLLCHLVGDHWVNIDGYRSEGAS